MFCFRNINDEVNLLLMFSAMHITSVRCRKDLSKTIFDSNDPILIATLLIYSKYNSKFFAEVLAKVTDIVNKALDNIRDDNNLLLYKEFWFILVFNKCPMLKNPTIQDKIDKKIDKLINLSASNAFGKTKHLL